MSEIVDVAEQYFDLIEEDDAEGADLEDLRKARNKWQSKMENLDEDDPLYEVAKENFEEKDNRLEEKDQARETLTELRTKILEKTANKFVPQKPWTEKMGLRAINKILLDKDRSYIKVDEVYLEDDSEVEDDEIMFEVAMAVRDVANEELGESTKLKEFWDNFQELKRFTYFEEIRDSDEPLKGSDIAERLGKDDKRQAISQALIETKNGDVNPYFREDGGLYSLSIVGEYLIQNYGNTDQSAGNDSREDGASLEDF
jgi:hypothetical protein